MSCWWQFFERWGKHIDMVHDPCSMCQIIEIMWHASVLPLPQKSSLKRSSSRKSCVILVKNPLPYTIYRIVAQWGSTANGTVGHESCRSRKFGNHSITATTEEVQILSIWQLLINKRWKWQSYACFLESKPHWRQLNFWIGKYRIVFGLLNKGTEIKLFLIHLPHTPKIQPTHFMWHVTIYVKCIHCYVPQKYSDPHNL